VLGSGQLGRMLAIEAKQLGYRIHTFSPEQDTPTGQIADRAVTAPYDDLDAIRAFAERVDVVTFEFENVLTEAAAAAESVAVVRPSSRALAIAQHRVREKTFLAERGLPVTPFEPVKTEDDLARAERAIARPAVLKTATFGYDGKGQIPLAGKDDLSAAWARLGRREAVLEPFIQLDRELSVLGSRAPDGQTCLFGPIENVHADHILDTSVAPADIPSSVAAEATRITRAVLEALEYVGILCIEFFLATDGRLLINEIAPRPHNSGHLTLDACTTSQFEQQVRAICGLPLGSMDMLQPAAMANILGDMWAGGDPNWAAALALPAVKLHLYGKAAPRKGRKMGHLTALATTSAEAKALAVRARHLLRPEICGVVSS
jgi:5-(carboxyamino)imidazole ribonucleotide synthase